MYNLKGAATIAFTKSLHAINQLGIDSALINSYDIRRNHQLATVRSGTGGRILVRQPDNAVLAETGNP